MPEILGATVRKRQALSRDPGRCPPVLHLVKPGALACWTVGQLGLRNLVRGKDETKFQVSHSSHGGMHGGARPYASPPG